MVHNIYTDLYRKSCGNSLEHSLLVNLFSYFGMFCDNLQFWDRKKGIDYGLVKWEGNLLYGEDVNIGFEGKKIRVSCRTHEFVESFWKLKNSLAEFLTGGDELLLLSLFENNG